MKKQTDIKKTNLAPCPFCGNKDVVMDCRNYDYITDYLVLCNNLNCVAEGPTGRTEEKAAEAWNKRHIEDSTQKYPGGHIMADEEGMQYCADCGKALLKKRNKNSREMWFITNNAGEIQ